MKASRTTSILTSESTVTVLSSTGSIHNILTLRPVLRYVLADIADACPAGAQLCMKPDKTPCLSQFSVPCACDPSMAFFSSDSHAAQAANRRAGLKRGLVKLGGKVIPVLAMSRCMSMSSSLNLLRVRPRARCRSSGMCQSSAMGSASVPSPLVFKCTVWFKAFFISMYTQKSEHAHSKFTGTSTDSQ